MKLELDNLTVEQVEEIMNVMRKELTDTDLTDEYPVVVRETTTHMEQMLEILEKNIDIVYGLEAIFESQDADRTPDDYNVITLTVNGIQHEFGCGAPMYQAMTGFIESMRSEI